MALSAASIFSPRADSAAIRAPSGQSPSTYSRVLEIPAWNMQFVFANSKPGTDRVKVQLAARTGEGAPGA
jgi:hypothetical protein